MFLIKYTEKCVTIYKGFIKSSNNIKNTFNEFVYSHCYDYYSLIETLKVQKLVRNNNGTIK